MHSKTTLPSLWWPLMGKPSIKADHCMICGRTSPLNDHHIVRRGAGRMFSEETGHELRKPTITLCGFGNNLQDPDGRCYCHGLAHANRLHFRWVPANAWKQGSKKIESDIMGHWEYLITDEPTKYQDALDMKGWKKLRY